MRKISDILSAARIFLRVFQEKEMQGDAIVEIRETTRLAGIDTFDGSSSGIFSNIFQRALQGQAATFKSLQVTYKSWMKQVSFADSSRARRRWQYCRALLAIA